MCEYCGCQQVEAIAELTREHDAIREVAAAAAAEAARGELALAQGHVVELQRLLAPHTAVEEHGLFPAMAREFPDHVSSLENDHHRIDEVLRQLTGRPVPSDWQQRLTAVLELLFEHILREQDGLFPAALATLTGADWDALALARTVAV